MSRVNTSGSELNLVTAVSVDATSAFCIACWVKLERVTETGQFPLALNDVAVASLPGFPGTHGLDFFWNIGGESSRVRDWTPSSVNRAAIDTTGQITNNTWYPWVFNGSSTDVDQYFGSLSNTGDAFGLQVDTNIVSLIVGGGGFLASDEMVGKIAHVCGWEGNLSGAEVTAFLGGADPNTLTSPTEQWFYYPLTTTSLTNQWSHSSWTAGTLAGDMTFDGADNPAVGSGLILAGTNRGLVNTPLVDGGLIT